MDPQGAALVAFFTLGPLSWAICWAIVRYAKHKWPKPTRRLTLG